VATGSANDCERHHSQVDVESQDLAIRVTNRRRRPDTASRCFWSRPEVNYLTSGIRSEIDRAPVMRRRGSLSCAQTAARDRAVRDFRLLPRHVRRMRMGSLTTSSSGTAPQPRWPESKWVIAGAADQWRTRSQRLLEQHRARICLVGDFNAITDPSTIRAL